MSLIEFLENAWNTLIAFFVVAFPWHKNCFGIKEILICPTGDRRNPVLRVLVRLLYEIVCDNILWHFLHFDYEELIFDIKNHFDLNVRKCNNRYYYYSLLWITCNHFNVSISPQVMLVSTTVPYPGICSSLPSVQNRWYLRYGLPRQTLRYEMMRLNGNRGLKAFSEEGLEA